MGATTVLAARLGLWMQALVSVFVMLAFFMVVAALLSTVFKPAVDMPPGVREVVLVLIGHLAGSFKDAVGFWIKSSYGSQQKTDLLARSPPIVEES